MDSKIYIKKTPFMSPPTSATFIFAFTLSCFYFCHLFNITTTLSLHYSNGLSSPNEVHATEPVGLLLGNRTNTFSREKEDKVFCLMFR